MRERCERHALALGPSGCPICRREQDAVAAAPSEAAVPATPSPSAAPRLPSAAPEPANTQPDSTPAAPTVTDAPERPRLSIRIHPAALLLVPLVALGAYWAVASGPAPAAPHGEGSSSADDARAALDPTEAEATASPPEGTTLEDGVEPAQDNASEPAESPAVIAARTAELERTREQAQLAAQQLDAARHRVKVVLYTTERCTRCTEARSHLVAQGIYPTERDIDKDAKARARHRALTRKGGLPTLEVDGKVLVGFQPERLDKAIQRAATLRLKPKPKPKKR
jgi:glutaredoxin 3